MQISLNWLLRNHHNGVDIKLLLSFWGHAFIFHLDLGFPSALRLLSGGVPITAGEKHVVIKNLFIRFVNGCHVGSFLELAEWLFPRVVGLIRMILLLRCFSFLIVWFLEKILLSEVNFVVSIWAGLVSKEVVGVILHEETFFGSYFLLIFIMLIPLCKFQKGGYLLHGRLVIYLEKLVFGGNNWLTEIWTRCYGAESRVQNRLLLVHGEGSSVLHFILAQSKEIGHFLSAAGKHFLSFSWALNSGLIWLWLWIGFLEHAFEPLDFGFDLLLNLETHLLQAEVFSVRAVLYDSLFFIVSDTDENFLIILLGEVDHLFEDVSPFLEETLLAVLLFNYGEGLLTALACLDFIWHLHCKWKY